MTTEKPFLGAMLFGAGNGQRVYATDSITDAGNLRRQMDILSFDTIARKFNLPHEAQAVYSAAPCTINGRPAAVISKIAPFRDFRSRDSFIGAGIPVFLDDLNEEYSRITNKLDVMLEEFMQKEGGGIAKGITDGSCWKGNARDAFAEGIIGRVATHDQQFGISNLRALDDVQHHVEAGALRATLPVKSVTTQAARAATTAEKPFLGAVLFGSPYGLEAHGVGAMERMSDWHVWPHLEFAAPKGGREQLAKTMYFVSPADISGKKALLISKVGPFSDRSRRPGHVGAGIPVLLEDFEREGARAIAKVDELFAKISAGKNGGIVTDSAQALWDGGAEIPQRILQDFPARPFTEGNRIVSLHSVKSVYEQRLYFDDGPEILSSLKSRLPAGWAPAVAKTAPRDTRIAPASAQQPPAPHRAPSAAEPPMAAAHTPAPKPPIEPPAVKAGGKNGWLIAGGVALAAAAVAAIAIFNNDKKQQAETGDLAQGGDWASRVEASKGTAAYRG